MKTQINHNITIEELSRKVSEFSDGDEVFALLEVVYARNHEGKWKFLIGNCLLGRGGTGSKEIYSDFSFIKEPIQNLDVNQVIDAIDNIGEDLGSEYSPMDSSKTRNLACTEYIVPSYWSSGTFPIRRFSVSLARDTFFLNAPLIGYGLPYRPSARLYIKEFLNLGRYHGERDADNGSLSIDVEDKRARIILQSEQIRIDTDNPDLMLVGQLSNSELVTIKKGQAHPSGKMDVETSDLWLINKKNEVIDFISASHCYFAHSEKEIGGPKWAKYINLIENGENHTCEFKSYINLSDEKNTKAEQVERTVCAFSNAAGGKLLIGVSDDGVIEGVGQSVRQCYQTPVNVALDLYIKAIKKRLNEKLRDGQCVDIGAVEIGDKYIVEVDVSRSKSVNYYLDTKQGFVRRGATSAKMTAADEREKPQEGIHEYEY
ncbi:helix-turn-helix domain-containing protein [Microbulbifer taiwanensis]|uniref:Helix-turn-helix domain-containing protein n=1 Tax=Microbulbifer taiwanensis TaxID=986746 RepID=A0ABW1YV38_9GAMM|nr:ATP-binding protein [Microbulbifer taiwanensis]